MNMWQSAVWRICILWTFKKKKKFIPWIMQLKYTENSSNLCRVVQLWISGRQGLDTAIIHSDWLLQWSVGSTAVVPVTGRCGSPLGLVSLPMVKGLWHWEEGALISFLKDTILTIEHSEIIRVNDNCSQSNCYLCSTTGGSCHLSIDLPLDSSQTLRAPRE